MPIQAPMGQPTGKAAPGRTFGESGRRPVRTGTGRRQPHSIRRPEAGGIRTWSDRESHLIQNRALQEHSRFGDDRSRPRVTCLVGKNESGKTNILHALHALNPALNDRLFDEQQYPRWLQKEHQRSGEFESALPISATFELTDQETQDISARFGEGVLLAKQWTLSVRYDNSGCSPSTSTKSCGLSGLRIPVRVRGRVGSLDELRSRLDELSE